MLAYVSKISRWNGNVTIELPNQTVVLKKKEIPKDDYPYYKIFLEENIQFEFNLQTNSFDMPIIGEDDFQYMETDLEEGNENEK